MRFVAWDDGVWGGGVWADGVWEQVPDDTPGGGNLKFIYDPGPQRPYAVTIPKDTPGDEVAELLEFARTLILSGALECH
jgi:hypothetical protein